MKTIGLFLLGVTFASFAADYGVDDAEGEGRTKAEACKRATLKAQELRSFSYDYNVVKKECACEKADEKSALNYEQWSCIAYVTWQKNSE